MAPAGGRKGRTETLAVLDHDISLRLVDTAIIGVSPFNSYFTTETIERIIGWIDPYCRSFVFYVPDAPTEFTLRALGYEPAKARRKARRQTNYVRNKIIRTLDHLGHDDPSPPDKILSHKVLDRNPIYLNESRWIRAYYDRSPEFKAAVLETTSTFLAGQTDVGGVSNNRSAQDLAIGKDYVLCELPVMISGQKILGGDSVAFCYHECPSYMKFFLDMSPTKTASSNQWFYLAPRFDAARPPDRHPTRYPVLAPPDRGENDAMAPNNGAPA